VIAGLIAVGVGGVAAVLRYVISRLVKAPWGVLVVNVVGSAIGGVALGLTSGDARLIVLGGLCGGLTTFSTLSVETIQLVRDGKMPTALGSMAANLVLGIIAAALGYLLTRS
jgi:CrcB protein